MCYFEQTQYLACNHNVEMVTEKCPLGEKYRTSMHDKIITALHSDEGKCPVCDPARFLETPKAGEETSQAEPNINDSTFAAPEVSSRPEDNLIDLTGDEPAPKRPHYERRDSKGEDLMDPN